ncbi:MAG: adenylate/guanylate cyclase domain-containing protein [Armatimonadota bacterium]
MSDPTVAARGSRPPLPRDCEQRTLGVAFLDLSRMAEWSSPAEDERVAAFLQEFYALVAQCLEPAGAQIVKFMGDAGLAMFPEDAAEQVALALADLARQARAAGAEHGLDVYLNANVHVGPALVGSFGAPGHERTDVIGKTVNIAARLGRRGITLSQQAYRCLSPSGRKRFEKVTQPTTYRLRL